MIYTFIKLFIMISIFIGFYKKFIFNNLFNISYNLLYYVSLAQIKVTKLINNYNNIINIKDNKLLIEYYKNDNLHNKIHVNELTNIKLDKNNHDYIIIKDENQNTLFYNNELTNLTFEKSNIKFLSLNIDYENNNYVINLKTDKHNFYIINNHIDKNFIKYYLANHLNIPISNNEIKYKIELIDHDVNFINLTEEDTIIIQKDNYIVKK